MHHAKPALLLGICALIIPTISHAANTPYRSAVLADGATAYYELDEISGNTSATDTAGGDNNGSVVGGVAFGQISAYPGLNTAAGFFGAEAIRIPDAATFDLGTGPFSLELWFYTDLASRGDLFTYKGGGGDFGLHSNSQSAGAVSVFFNGFVASPAAAGLSQWHHVAFTRDAAGTVGLYLAGDLLNSGTDTDTLNIANDLLIGSNHSGDPSNLAIQFTGNIDEVAWYPVALTEAQMNNHIALAQVPEPSAAVLALAAGSLLGLRPRR